MGWEDLLAPEGGTQKVLPWTGGRQVFGEGRTWNLRGRQPQEHGWYSFDVSGGRKARLVGEAEADMDYDTGRKVLRGYLVGDRLIPDGTRVVVDPNQLITQTLPVRLVEPGLDRFARAVVAEREDGQFIYVRQEFPQGAEAEVEAAYQDRKGSVDGIKDVTPALDLSFRWLSHQRTLTEERQRELANQRAAEEAQRLAEERRGQFMQNVGNPAVRRQLALVDFDEAARAALAMTNSELLDTQPGFRPNEMTVRYRTRGRRLECVVEKDTLRVVEAGICLEDYRTGTKGDTLFTLESLPAVVGEAMDTGRLHVYRDLDHNWGRD